MSTSASLAILISCQCDLVEINHCHDENGKLKFVQCIAWDWAPDRNCFDAQQWVMVEAWSKTRYGAVIRTGCGQPIRIKCKYFRETWTNYDPERENTKEFPEKYRRKVWQ